MTAKTMAQMRSSTAAASIQSFFISFSLAASWRCSSSLWTRFLRRSRISRNSFIIDSTSIVSIVGRSPLRKCRFFLGICFTNGGGDCFMHRHAAANLSQKRFFICYVKNTTMTIILLLKDNAKQVNVTTTVLFVYPFVYSSAELNYQPSFAT